MRSLFFALFFSAFSPFSTAQKWEKGNPLHDVLRSDTAFKKVIEQKEIFQPQVVFIQIDRDAANRPSFRTWTWNVDAERYFYPASTVKLPTALAALEWLNRQKVIGLDRKTPFFVEKGRDLQTASERDTSNFLENAKPTVEHYIKKILLVSDNDAFNRLYELLGQAHLNRTLREKGAPGARVVHRLSVAGFGPTENKFSNPVRFVSRDGETLFQRGEVFSDGFEKGRIFKNEVQGRGFFRGDSLVLEPFDFSKKNALPLMQQLLMLRDLVFRPFLPHERHFDITDDDRRFVLKYMSMWPRESKNPRYSEPDGYCKFLVLGGKDEKAPPDLRIFNKVGDAYGYLLDVAYVVDFDSKTEFLAAAVVACNSDGIFNDDKYDYETVGFPFFRALGQRLLEHEKARKKAFLPDLSEFKFDDYRN